MFQKRTKSKRGISSNSVSQGENIENSRLKDPNDPLIIINSIFDMPENNRVKPETLSYPDTRFQHSTTLFPAKGIEEKCVPSEISDETFKRSAEDDLNSTTSKKLKVSDSSETKPTISDDCMIIEKPKKRIKIDFVDLTEDSQPVVPVECSPVKTAFLKNRQPIGNKHTRLLSDIRVKVEPSENTSEVSADNVHLKVKSSGNTIEITANEGLARTSYPVIQAEQNNAGGYNKAVSSDNNIKAEPSLSSEITTGVNSENSHNDDDSLASTSNPVIQAEKHNARENEKEVNSDNNIIIKNEPSFPSENNTRVNSVKSEKRDDCLKSTSNPVIQDTKRSNASENNSEVIPNNNILIKTEPSVSVENNTKVISERSHNADDTLGITSNPVIEDTERNNAREVTSDNNILIKIEPNFSNGNNTGVNSEKSHIANNHDRDEANRQILASTTASVDTAKYGDGSMSSVNHLITDVSIKEEQNGNWVINNNPTSISNITSDANQTYKCSFDRPVESGKHAVNNSETQENLVCDKHKNDMDPSVSSLLNSARVKSEPEEKNENSCNNEKSQRCGNTGVIPSEISNVSHLNQESCSSNTKDDIYSGDQQETFPTPFLKYLNCNRKIDILELSNARTVLNNLIRNKININVIPAEVIPDSNNSRNNTRLCLTERKKVLQDLQINEKPSLNLAVGETLQSNSSLSKFKMAWNSNLNNTNSDSISIPTQLEKSSNESHMQNSLNSDKIHRNNVPNISFELSSNKNDSTSQENNFDMPMNIQCPLDDGYLPTFCVSPLDEIEQSETLCNQPLEAKKDPNELSNDFLHQVLDNANSTRSESIANLSSSLNFFDPVAKSDDIIEQRLLQNLRRIRLLQNKKSTENINSTSNVNEKISARKVQNSENMSAGLLVPHENVFKQTQKLRFNPCTTYAEALETPPKKIKISEHVSVSNSDKKNEAPIIGSPNYPSDHSLEKHLGSGLPSNIIHSSPRSINFVKKRCTPPSNNQNPNSLICPAASLENPGSHHMIHANYSRDPRLARNYSQTLDRDVNSQDQLGSSNIGQVYPSPIVPESKNSPILSQKKPAPSVSTTYAVRNSSSVRSFAGPVLPAVNVKIQQVKPMLLKINDSNTTDFNKKAFNKNIHVPPIVPGNTNSMAQHHNLDSAIQNVEGSESFSHLPVNTSSPSVHRQNLVSQQIRQSTSLNSALTHGHYSSESISYEFILNKYLVTSNPPPHLPHAFAPTVVIGKQSASCDPKSLLEVNENIGRKIINSSDIYRIIIERNVDWFHGIDKETVQKVSEIGGEVHQVRNDYANHLMYYNTYLPFLLFEYFNKISMALKEAKAREETGINIYKVDTFENKKDYVFFWCQRFINRSDMDSIPREGHIILIKFDSDQTGKSARMLGYVSYSGTRSYKHDRDYNDESLKDLNVNTRKNLRKVRISCHSGMSDITLNSRIHISKLTNIKKTLMLNDALIELQRSPLCNIVLNPQSHNIKCIVLPRRQDIEATTSVVQAIVDTLKVSSPQITIVVSGPFTDSLSAIVQVVEDIKRCNIPGQILVCVRAELLSEMGMRLIETSNSLIIINKEREFLQNKLRSIVLDEIFPCSSDAQKKQNEEAKRKALQEVEVLLAVTGTCFRKDVQEMVRDLAYCIMHDAHNFTEPESVRPLSYGIKHLILFGDPNERCHASSKCSASLGYESLFRRIYNSC